MPWGIIVDCSSVALGGLLGGTLGKYFPQRICDYLSKFFGITSIAVGINLIGQTQSLSPVILALLLGAIIGEALKLEEHMDQLPIRFGCAKGDSIFVQKYTSVLILICFGSLGLIGAMTEGMTGDSSLLFIKAMLDFSGGAIFAASLGISVALVALPQFVLYLLLFFGASFIMPYIDTRIIADFSACGGVIALTAGLRIADIKPIRIASLLPALLFVIPVSGLWHRTLG